MKKKLKFLKPLLIIITITSILLSLSLSTYAKSKAPTVNIKWNAHASFTIKANNTTIITDPYDESIGYKFPSVTANIVTSSHDHFDHNNTSIVKGIFDIIKTTGKFNIKGISIKGITSFHDTNNGADRGMNNIYTYKINDISICHLGDLGQSLSKSQIKEIGKIDVLMIPVGGFYTMDLESQLKVVNELKPKVIIPMHYKTKLSSSDFDSLTDNKPFIDSLKCWKSITLDDLTLDKKSISSKYNKTIVNLTF